MLLTRTVTGPHDFALEAKAVWGGAPVLRSGNECVVGPLPSAAAASRGVSRHAAPEIGALTRQ